ncbi:MAG: hypothetical protein AAB641_01890 [Patescibacteria group bacterium]
MVKVIPVLGILLTMLWPNIVHGEELLPAICEQIITPDKNLSIPDIIKEHIATRIREIPGEIARDTKEVVSSIGDSIGETLGANKDEAFSRIKSQVLGTSTANALQSNFSDLLLRHWVWALSALGLMVIGFFFLI